MSQVCPFASLRSLTALDFPSTSVGKRSPLKAPANHVWATCCRGFAKMQKMRVCFFLCSGVPLREVGGDEPRPPWKCKLRVLFLACVFGIQEWIKAPGASKLGCVNLFTVSKETAGQIRGNRMILSLLTHQAWAGFVNGETEAAVTLIVCVGKRGCSERLLVLRYT